MIASNVVYPSAWRLRKLLPPILAFHAANAKAENAMTHDGYTKFLITEIGNFEIHSSIQQTVLGRQPVRCIDICSADYEHLSETRHLSLTLPPEADDNIDIENIEIDLWNDGPWEDELIKLCTAELSNDDD